MFDLLTIGDCTWDTFLDIENASLEYGAKSHRPEKLVLPYGDKIDIHDTFESMGGNAANVAVGVERMGFRSAISTELGTDTQGVLIHKNLIRNHIETDYLKKNSKRRSRYSVVLNFKGERTILSYFDKIPYQQVSLPPSKYLYYTSLGFSFETIQKKVIAYKKSHPKTILTCNPGSYQLKEKKSVFAKILPHTDILFVNKEEAERLVGEAPSTKTLLHKLLKTGVKTAVLTDGIVGSSVSNGEHFFSCGIYHVPIVSKTGAGDAYASGFLAAHMNGLTLAECMLWGTANAASVTGHLGAQTGLLDETGIKKFIKNHPLPQALNS